VASASASPGARGAEKRHVGERVGAERGEAGREEEEHGTASMSDVQQV
jgi:hypothetical protein